MVEPLRLGILGSANIALHLVAGLAGSNKVRAVAVASRSGEQARAFAASTGVPRALDSYQALLADPAVDAIYNPLPNSLHAEWTIRALEAGKPVLCEKPVGLTAVEARAMYATADRTGLPLREAYPYRAQPQTQRLAQIVRSGEIGRPRLIQASFGFPVANPANIRLDPALGGGALLDAGCYAISLIRLLAGEPPAEVSAQAVWTDRGVDGVLTAQLRFPGGLLAQAACAFGTALHRTATVACEGGVIRSDFLNHLTEAEPGILEVARGGWELRPERIDFPPANGFRLETESFADLVRGTGPWTGIEPGESIEVMEVLDAVIASARDGGRPVALR